MLAKAHALHTLSQSYRVPSHCNALHINNRCLRFGLRRCSCITRAGANDPKSPNDIYAAVQARVQELVKAAERASDEVTHVLTPREAYDGMDIALMLVSTLIFMWMAAAFYSVYAHWCAMVAHHTAF